MKDRPNDLLLLAGKVLTVLMQLVLGIAALALVIAIPLVLIFSDTISAKIVADYGDVAGAFPLASTLGVLAIVLVMVCLAFVFFGKLRAIISTVGDGDPFAPENAERLSLMGWLMLVVQAALIPLAALAYVIIEWAEPLEGANVAFDVGLDIEGILLVVILFILARVFKHGAAMREDLEGTV